MDNAKEFVEKKNEYMTLVKKKKDILRQIEIAELEAKKARRILKQVGDVGLLSIQKPVVTAWERLDSLYLSVSENNEVSAHIVFDYPMLI